jgi:hypothetical protein
LAGYGKHRYHMHEKNNNISAHDFGQHFDKHIVENCK